MKFVVQRTGLSPHVLRVWERRYGAVTPVRSESNRRLYAEEEEKPRTTYLQGALFALDPRTGEVRAMVGGRDFGASRWNRGPT